MGRCLHTYDLRRGLNLVFLTRPQTPSIITATCAWKDRVFAAWGEEGDQTDSGIWVFKRGQKVGELEKPLGKPARLKRLVIFGPWIVGVSDDTVEVWKTESLEHYTTITPTTFGSGAGGHLTGDICSMPTYVNKVFVGKRDGSIDIWNVSTGKLVYTILPSSPTRGAVTALEPSPALSILAIAYADGSVILHSVREDRALLRLTSAASQSATISSISFRTDGLGGGEDGSQPGIMATASHGSGDITFWDLNNGGRVRGVLRGAHDPPSASISRSGVNKIEFLPGQDVILSSGLDNSLKSWIFDERSLSPTPRILHSRSGHGAPVTRLSFVPTNSDGSENSGKWLMSSGRDQSLWGWSLRRDGQSTELSQGNVRSKAKKLGGLANGFNHEPTTTLEDLKAPEITGIACSLNRDGGMGAAAGGGKVWTNTTSKKSPGADEIAATGWESVVTSHRGDKVARTWLWGRKKAGRWAFESADSTEVTAIGITACGTFALVGSAGGSISAFNLQSGIMRQRFPKPLTKAQAQNLETTMTNGDIPHSDEYQPGRGKHRKAVTGLCVDSFNRTLISCSLDGNLKFWDFANGQLKHAIDWSPMSSITSLHYHRPNDLIALTCDDFSIRIVDIETKKLVRELWGCMGQISDAAFSNDGRWVIAASADSVIRVWDLPTGHLINAMRVSSPCTALAFSDTGEYLATAHADTVGINIWNNRTLFAHVPTRPIREDEIVESEAPTSSGEHGQHLVHAATEPPADDEIEENDDTALAPHSTSADIDDINDSLMSLSLVPPSRWQTLLNLDTIRLRNKPVQPPKPPEKAPFFLPSLAPSSAELDSSKQHKQLLPSQPSTDAASNDLPLTLTPADKSRIAHLPPSLDPRTASSLLLSSHSSGDYAPFIAHLSSLGPSAADLAIRTLTTEEWAPFVEALTWRLRQRRDFELLNTWMSVFLRLHGREAVGQARDEGVGEDGGGGAREKLVEWREVLQGERERLGRLVGGCLGGIGFVRSVR